VDILNGNIFSIYPREHFLKGYIGSNAKECNWNTKGEQNCLVNPIHNCIGQ